MRLAEGGLLAAHHLERRIGRQAGQEACADREIGKALQLGRVAHAVERMAVGTQHRVERLHMDGVRVGEGTVNVEKQRAAHESVRRYSRLLHGPVEDLQRAALVSSIGLPPAVGSTMAMSPILSRCVPSTLKSAQRVRDVELLPQRE